ncbi:MAG: TRAM domain-containing protein, partial [Oscillospiraceae bacterium]|nr:TRAM domain-containing protein [Oscillospiraceae bacterium]
KQVKFDNIYSFIYSKRVGTRAAMMEDSITDEEKSVRFRRMLELQREISTEHYKRFVGRTMRVLFENESRRDGYIGGKSDESVIVEAKGSTDNIGQFRDVKITAAHNWAVDGEIV